MNLEYKYEDLTVNLPTLDFNSIINEDTVSPLPLRSRSHCLFVNGCIHCYFYSYTMNIYRKACARLLTIGSDVHLTKFMLEINDSGDMQSKVGVIGYGRLGSAICKDLIDSRIVQPHNLLIFTRNQDAASKMKDKSVIIDNQCSIIPIECAVILICVLASQIESVAKKLRGRLPFETVLYVFTSGVSLARLRQLFMHNGIITEHYLWNDSLHSTWNPRLTISAALDNPSIVTSTCPLPISLTSAKYINCLPKLFTLWIYSLCNVGSSFGLSAQDSVKLLNFVLFEPDKGNLIEVNDIVEGLDNVSDTFPELNLCSITEQTTFIDQKIIDNEPFAAELLVNYQNVLNTFSTFKKFNVN